MQSGGNPNIGAGSGIPARSASQCMPSMRRAPEEIAAKVHENITRQQQLH